MIITKYPDYVEDQLKMLDEQIQKIYDELTPKEPTATLCNYYEIDRRRRLAYEMAKPLLDEKVRLVTNSCPSYIVIPDK